MRIGPIASEKIELLYVLALGALPAVVGAGCADATEPQFQAVHALQPIPDSAYVEVGESVDFKVRVLDQWGNELPDRVDRVEWSLLNSEVATLETGGGGASVTALEPGKAVVLTELGRGEGRAHVLVPPPGLDRIEIQPHVINLTVGSFVEPRPRVRLLDTDGNELNPAGFPISWSAGDTTVVRVTRNANRIVASVFGKSEGRTYIRARVGPRSASVDAIVILEPQPPGPPDIVPVSSTTLEVTWARMVGANDGYRVARATSSGGPFTEIASTGTGGPFASVDTTYVDPGLSPATTYFYTVRACNGHGCSEPSEPGSATTPDEDGQGRER